MGLFSSKKIFVDSFVQPLVEEAPEFIQDSVQRSIINDRPITQDLLTNALNGPATKMNRFYRYGRDEYFYDLPEGTYRSIQADYGTVERVLEQNIVNQQVLVEVVIADDADPIYFSYEYLITQRGWNPVNNEISIIGSEFPSGSGASPWIVSDGDFISPTQVQLTYSRRVRNMFGGDDSPDEITQFHTEVANTPQTVNELDKYYHVVYRLIDEEGNVGDTLHYWYYNVRDNTYPSLAAPETQGSSFFPVVPLRVNKRDQTSDKESEVYRTSKQILDIVGSDIDQLAEGINASPDIADVNDAVVLFAISTQTESQASKRYLFNFFNELRANQTATRQDYEQWDSGPKTIRRGGGDDDPSVPLLPPTNSIQISEANGSYNVNLYWLFTESTLVDGVIGKVNQVETETVLRGSQRIGSSIFSSVIDQSSLYIRKQVSPNTYQQIEVFGLVHRNAVRGRPIFSTLRDAVVSANDPDNFKEGLLIPLDFQVYNSLAFTDRNDVFYDSFRILFNTFIVKKLRWYQTGFFQFVFLVIAVVVTVYTGGDFISTATALGTVAGFTGTAALIVGAALYAATIALVSYGVSLAVEVFGEEFGVVLALVTVYFQFSGNNPAFLGPTDLSAIQSGVSQGFGRIVANIQDEFSDLLAEQERLQDELAEERAELGLDQVANPYFYSFLEPTETSPYVTPEQFYNLRIHTGNLAGVPIKAIENNVSNGLRLDGVDDLNGLSII